MDSLIPIAIASIKVIIAITKGIRSAPEVVEKASRQSQQLEAQLGALQRKYQANDIGDADMEGWLLNLRICNTTLHKIETLLETYAGRHPFVAAAKFQCGQRGELSGLVDELEKCTKHFRSYVGLVLPGTQPVQPQQQQDCKLIRSYEPAISLDQFVHMQAASEDADC